MLINLYPAYNSFTLPQHLYAYTTNPLTNSPPVEVNIPNIVILLVVTEKCVNK